MPTKITRAIRLRGPPRKVKTHGEEEPVVAGEEGGGQNRSAAPSEREREGQRWQPRWGSRTILPSCRHREHPPPPSHAPAGNSSLTFSPHPSCPPCPSLPLLCLPVPSPLSAKVPSQALNPCSPAASQARGLCALYDISQTTSGCYLARSDKTTAVPNHQLVLESNNTKMPLK